ncbi:MAG TPA: lysoplasmalogenase family protein, partial [Candidatus Lustribacter sp.]|nr:lysoplasmalogenase family protein [Candidatus Lustribacter sp.]
MNIYAWVLLGALAVAAPADWVCVHRGFREGERLAAPAFMVLLLALAWLLGADLVGYGRWLLIGLVASLVGDLFLLGDTEERFRAGLGSFLAVHLAYLAMILTLPSHGSPLWVSVVLVALTAGVASYRLILPLVREVPGEGVPLLGYALVLALVAMAAWWHG